MLDKKGHIKKLVSLSARRTKNKGISTYQFERELLNRLIAYVHASNSVHSFSLNTLDLISEHPAFSNKVMSFWRCDANSLHVIAPHDLPLDMRQGLYDRAKEEKKWQPLDISYHYLQLNPLFDINSRVDISLEKENNTLFYFSFWSSFSEKELASLIPFCNDFFGIFNLCLVNLLNKKHTKLLKTILEKAIDSIEITNEEAVIQYVNPAFEKITPFQQ